MVYSSEEEVMNMEKYEENGDSIWREPDPEEKEAISIWGRSAYRARIWKLWAIGGFWAFCSLLLGIAAAGKDRHGDTHPTSGLIIGLLIFAVYIIGALIIRKGYSNLRKRILDGDYKVTETTVKDKQLIFRRRRAPEECVTVISGDRQDTFRILDPDGDDIYETIGLGDRMLLICYPGDTYGFADKLDLVYLPPFIKRAKEEKAEGSDA